ncbi:MAG: AbrB/MazE/SpoVT family DNA-binding domain-containing protein [Candidatus Njordarchaeota archaeon]
MKVTRNRQITIPANISKIVGIKEGDLVDVSVSDERIIIKKIKKIEELAGSWADIDERDLLNSIKERWKNWLNIA